MHTSFPRPLLRPLSRPLLRALGLAAAGGLLAGGPAMAGLRPTGEGSGSIALPTGAESSPVVAANPPVPTATPAAAEIAQTYPLPEVKEGYSANGWYLTIGAGYQDPTNQSVHSDDFPNNSSIRLGLGGGFSGDVGVGYDFGALRTELTYGYSRASLNSLSGSGGWSDNNVSGAINKNDVLVSLYYDVDTNSRWTPYIGGGIGYTNLSTPSLNIDGYRTGGANKGLFGWQAKLGVSYAMSYNTDIYLEGVYQGANGFTDDNVRFDSFNSWGGKLGFRYRFGAKPVAVVAAPAPEPEPMVQPAPAPMPMPQPEAAPAPIRGLW